jgi:hypothetical protein
MTTAASCPLRAVEPYQPKQRLADEQRGAGNASTVITGAAELAALAQLMGKRAAAVAIQAGRQPAPPSGGIGTGIKQVTGAPSVQQEDRTT